MDLLSLRRDALVLDQPEAVERTAQFGPAFVAEDEPAARLAEQPAKQSFEPEGIEFRKLGAADAEQIGRRARDGAPGGIEGDHQSGEIFGLLEQLLFMRHGLGQPRMHGETIDQRNVGQQSGGQRLDRPAPGDEQIIFVVARPREVDMVLVRAKIAVRAPARAPRFRCRSARTKLRSATIRRTAHHKAGWR